MSGPLDNMSSLAAANSEAGLQQQLHSPELWRRLQLFRLAVVSSSSGEPTAESRDKRTKLVLGLLKDVELRVLFVAVDFCHGQAGDEVKQGAVEVALLSVLGSSVGQKLLQENNADLVPFFLAGLCHPTPGVKKLTAKALLTLGLGGAGGGGGGERVQLDEDGGRSTRCRQLLQPPLLPALVAALGDGDTGAAQAMADTLLSLCEEADRPHATGAAGAASGEALACRRAVLGALASQVGEVVAGLTARQASIPKLRFADTAARLMSVSDSAFSAALDAGALPLVTDLTEDASDVLIQLNALELLEQVASTAGGARHLVAKGHLDRLLVSAGGGGGSDPETPDPLLGASALRTLAKVLAKAEGVGLDVWRERRSSFMAGFLRACAVHLEGRDEAGKLAGLVAASTAAEASNDALKAMLAQNHGAEGGVLDAWLTLSAHKVEVKAAALHAVSLVLSTPPSPATPTPTPTPTASTTSESASASASAAIFSSGGGGGGGHGDEDGDEVMGNTTAATGVGGAEEEKEEERGSLRRMLFERVGVCNNRQTTGGLLLDLARQPVPEIRHAAYDVLRCTVWQPGGWGLAAVFTQPGFRDFIQEREDAGSKSTKEWKFSVVESIMACKERAVLGEELLDSFREMLKQGPFFVPARRRDVATAE
eukprot:g13474.t1